MTKLKPLLICRVRAAGINWDYFYQNAAQIIVFGSYALSANTTKSDLDVLCIGNGKRYKSSKLHIIWISEQRIRSKQWLGSELATHIAAYGKWIKGKNDWAHKTKPGRKTIERKKQKILSRLDAAERHWDDLLPKFQAGQLTKLRRDLQRYQMMKHGKAPVPKSLLDTEWRLHKTSDAWTALLANRSEVARRIKKFFIARKIAKLATKI